MHGVGTCFSKEIAAGDAIEVYNPQSKINELRVCRFVAADVSLSLSAPFSSNITQPSHFVVMKKPSRASTATSAAAGFAVTKAHATATGSTQLQPGARTITLRVRDGAGYKYVTEVVDASKAMSNEDLLDMRAKRKSDKFC